MSKNTPVVFIMLSVVLLSIGIIGVTTYYGEANWLWIAQQVATFSLLFVVLGVCFYTLMGWLRRR